MSDLKIKTVIDTKELESLVQELMEYASDSENITDDGMNDRLHYIQEAAITAFYGDEFWDWYNSKLE